MSEKCILIKREDYKKLEDDSYYYKKIKPEYESQKSQISQLKAKIKEYEDKESELNPKLNVNIDVEFGKFEYAWGLYKNIFNPTSIEHIYKFEISIGDDSVTPKGKIHSFLLSALNNVKSYIFSKSVEHISNEFKEQFDKYEETNKRNKEEIERLKGLIEEHNKKCIFKRNKIKI